eukprot:GHVT01005593.1.p1 GENE.GHVT01005593.1~~GHVT01005593.1.p1  ORF type:complete len:174 (-),score=3.35 GHVT01005593.1:105-626(-)
MVNDISSTSNKVITSASPNIPSKPESTMFLTPQPDSNTELDTSTAKQDAKSNIKKKLGSQKYNSPITPALTARNNQSIKSTSPVASSKFASKHSEADPKQGERNHSGNPKNILRNVRQQPRLTLPRNKYNQLAYDGQNAEKQTSSFAKYKKAFEKTENKSRNNRKSFSRYRPY